MRLVITAMLQAFRASGDGVVASTGTSSFCIDADHSPRRERSTFAAVPDPQSIIAECDS